MAEQSLVATYLKALLNESFETFGKIWTRFQYINLNNDEV